MTILDELAKIFQSRRVARDMLEGRKIDEGDMWWFDSARRLESIEAERSKQAQQQSDQDPFKPSERLLRSIADANAGRLIKREI